MVLFLFSLFVLLELLELLELAGGKKIERREKKSGNMYSVLYIHTLVLTFGYLILVGDFFFKNKFFFKTSDIYIYIYIFFKKKALLKSRVVSSNN